MSDNASTTKNYMYILDNSELVTSEYYFSYARLVFILHKLDVVSRDTLLNFVSRFKLFYV